MGQLVYVAFAGKVVGRGRAHPLFRDAEGRRKLATHAEGPLAAGPDGEAIALPLGERSTSFERSVGDIGHGVSGLYAAARTVRSSFSPGFQRTCLENGGTTP